jgi:large subunit ribosomal protein L32e
MKSFLRQQGNYKKRIKKNWRKPKGRHSKLREKRHGLHAMPEIGYKRHDYVPELLISNVKQIESLKKGAIVMIASSVGNKKKIDILEACAKKGIIVKNYKKGSEVISKIKEELTKRKEKKVKHMKSKAEKKEASKKLEAEKEKEKKVAEEESKKKVVVKKSETSKEETHKPAKKVVKKKEED